MYQVYAAKQASAVVFNGEHITQNCPFPWEGSGPPRNTCMVTGPAPLHKENAMSIDPALFPPKTVHVPLVLYDGTDPYPPQNCPFPWGDLDPVHNMFTTAQPTPHAKWHLDQTTRYCRIPVRCAHRHIHRQTTPQVSSNMPHLQRVQKNGTSILLSATSPNANRFSTFFHQWTYL